MNAKTEETFASEAMPHLNDLYRTAVRLTRSPEAAEDIVQEVFLQAWKSFADYEQGTNCRAWLYKILFFKISHHRRSLVVQSKFFQSDDEEGTLFARAIAPQIIERHLTDGEVIHAVDSLPANYRAVVLLADVEEFDYKEIARILNVPIGTVMSRLSRARQQLRKSLTGAAREFGIKNLGAIVQRQTAACAA
jgi:RNA polymerase sigma-70 factor (ECF subfamily)